jgi:hypothetical protein
VEEENKHLCLAGTVSLTHPYEKVNLLQLESSFFMVLRVTLKLAAVDHVSGLFHLSKVVPLLLMFIRRDEKQQSLGGKFKADVLENREN